MYWYWKARIYNDQDNYGMIWIRTNRELHEIDVIQDFYTKLTGCKLMLEGMSELAPEKSNPDIGLDTFHILWRPQ